MLAVIRTGGKQYIVTEGQTLKVEKLATDTGTFSFDEVLMVSDKETKVGDPILKNAKVTATILGLVRGPKIDVRKYKAKVRYRRKIGHRQTYTQVKIDKISA